jgi:hypothetical protein
LIPNIERIEGDAEYRDELRYRCQTDYFFLGQVLGKGFNKLDPVIHKLVAELYGRKKPGLPIEEQDPVKNILHIDPRETYKTTFGHLDSIQCVTIDPDMTVLNEGATKPLAKAISNVQSSVFVQAKGRRPTPFQAIFPDYCVDKAGDGWYQAPCRTYAQVDMTIDTTSVATSQAGFHPWVFNADDAVDTDNSGIRAKDEVRQGVISNHNTNINTRRRGGYLRARGTRYHPFELWNFMLTQAKQNPENWRVLVRSAMRLKNKKRLLPGEFPKREDIDLAFPGIVTYEELKEKFEASYETFMCQQMNDPQGGGLQIITEDLYESCALAEERVPLIGEVLIFWRPQYQGKDYMAQFAEGAAVRVFGGKVYVIDAWRGMYTPSSFSEKVVEVCRKHQTGALGMEATPGAREYLNAAIMNEAAKKNRSLRITWEDFEDEDGLRLARLKSLEPMMEAGRLQISRGAGMGPEMKRQFVHLGMIPDNGIIDSISRLALRIPASVIKEEIDRVDLEAHQRSRANGMYDFVFKHGGIEAVEQKAAEPVIKIPRGYPGLPDILGGLDG